MDTDRNGEEWCASLLSLMVLACLVGLIVFSVRAILGDL